MVATASFALGGRLGPMALAPAPKTTTQMRRPRHPLSLQRCRVCSSSTARILQGDPAQHPAHTPIQQITPSKDSAIPPRCISRAAFSLVVYELAYEANGCRD
jgi:hypothetical protein